MSIFKSFRQAISGGPEFQHQDSFNSYVVLAYSVRHNFNSFEEFWHGEIPDFKHDEKSTVVQIFFSPCVSDYPKDDLLRTQFPEACLWLEERIGKDNNFADPAYNILNSIRKLVVDGYDTRGKKLPAVGRLFAESHKEPEKRVEYFKRDYFHYEALIEKKFNT